MTELVISTNGPCRCPDHFIQGDVNAVLNAHVVQYVLDLTTTWPQAIENINDDYIMS